jgi:lambda repressor-like predicted transcriptional regulator
MGNGTIAFNVIKVRALIEKTGLKKQKIAELGGINKATLSTALKRGYARRTTVAAIARVLDISEQEIAA